jgi:hypothetical protein
VSDEVDERFKDLDYPGRRKPVNRGGQPVEKPKPVEWDARPLYYNVGGVKQEFFIIGHLAKALGYSVQSIRLWESQGLLPPSPYRSPRTKGMVAGGRSNKGKRLWTRAQIEGIVRLAAKHKVILNKVPPTKQFAADVQRLFASLVNE